MTTAVRCSMCTNELGATHCIGCDQYFCTNDFQTHRQNMINEMDKIIEERNHLQDEISNKAQANDQQNSVFEQIDRWQKSTIEKVIQVATQARQQAIELLNNRRMEFKSFAQNLADIKESGNYVEHDLRRLKQMINHFKQALIDSIQSTTILLHTEQSDRINWESLIYVEDQQAIVIRKPQIRLNCRGRSCPKCGKCNDWYVDNIDQRLKRRDGATCRHHGGPGGHSPYGPHYVVCTCKLNKRDLIHEFEHVLH